MDCFFCVMFSGGFQAPNRYCDCTATADGNTLPCRTFDSSAPGPIPGPVPFSYPLSGPHPTDSVRGVAVGVRITRLLAPFRKQSELRKPRCRARIYTRCFAGFGSCAPRQWVDGRDPGPGRRGNRACVELTVLCGRLAGGDSKLARFSFGTLRSDPSTPQVLGLSRARTLDCSSQI